MSLKLFGRDWTGKFLRPRTQKKRRPSKRLGLEVLEARDVPTTVQFNLTGYSVGETAGSANITVVLNAPSSQEVRVSYNAGGGTATAGSDYTGVNGTLTFAPGVTALSFSVPILNDTAVESDETVGLSLSNTVNATLGNPMMATLTITDDETPATTVTVAATDPTAAESGPMGMPESGAFTVSRTGSTAGALSVSYSVGGTATNGTDYMPLSGTVTIPAG
jgi:hypothetical protein